MEWSTRSAVRAALSTFTVHEPVRTLFTSAQSESNWVVVHVSFIRRVLLYQKYPVWSVRTGLQQQPRTYRVIQTPPEKSTCSGPERGSKKPPGVVCVKRAAAFSLKPPLCGAYRADAAGNRNRVSQLPATATALTSSDTLYLNGVCRVIVELAQYLIHRCGNIFS